LPKAESQSAVMPFAFFVLDAGLQARSTRRR
jgi:hypothetical protein